MPQLDRLSKDKAVKNAQQVRCQQLDVGTRIIANNTPPAFRQISAPRGVTRFWDLAK